MAAITSTHEPVLDAGMVTYRMFDAYQQMVESYREHEGLSLEEAFTKVDNVTETHLHYLTHSKPQDVTWHNLSTLTRMNPKIGQYRWEMIKRAARKQFLAGELAADALHGDHETVWQHAKFLAIRESMAEEWQPRGGIEHSLIDTLCLSYLQYLQWLDLLNVYTHTERIHERTCESKCGKLPPPTARIDMQERAVAMVDRFNRIYLRTLRQLRDLRRYSVTINADQVNIGQQQINTTGSLTSGHPAETRQSETVNTAAGVSYC